jgi:RNA polymerase sigma-70 factor (ECF subfamily)
MHPTKALSDEQLIEFLLQGQTAALDELYERYARKLFVFCDHTLGSGNPQDAEDLVQEIFMRVIKAAHTFDPTKASFRTWLYRIARNRCIDARRRRGRFTFLHLDQHSATDVPDDHPPLEEILPAPDENIESQIIETTLNQAIRDCIQALENEEERQAILLYYLAEKVYREIAEILGKSLSTAKNRVHTAQEKVKDCLAAKGFP